MIKNKARGGFYNVITNPITKQVSFIEAEEVSESSDEILHDSGADKLFMNEKQFHMVEHFTRDPQDVRCGSGTVVDMIQGVGYIWFLGVRFKCCVALKLAVSVVSVGYCAREGIVSTFHEKGLTIDCRMGTIEYPLSTNNLYYLLPEYFCQGEPIVSAATVPPPTVMIADAVVKDKVALLHQRLGHSCNKRLIAMARDELYIERGVLLTPNEIKAAAGKFCIICAMAKSTVKKKVGKTTPHVPALGELFHVDMTGPNATPSLSGYRYTFLIVESVTGKVWVYFTAKKDDESILAILEQFEREHVGSVHPTPDRKYFMSDNGEMASEKVRAFVRQNGYFSRFTPAYHSEWNGFVEVRIRMCKSISKCLLAGAKLPEPFWEHSDKHAVFLIGILPPCDTTELKRDPDTLWYGRTYDYSKLRIWGSVAVVNLHKPAKNRLPTGVTGIFIGVSEAEYLVYVPESRTILSSADVTFYEKIDNVPDTVTHILESAAGREHTDGMDPITTQPIFHTEDFEKYVNTVHYDVQDKLYYVVTKIRIVKGSVVADRLACVDGELPATDTIYAAHLLEYTEIDDQNIIEGLKRRSPTMKQFFFQANAAGRKKHKTMIPQTVENNPAKGETTGSIPIRAAHDGAGAGSHESAQQSAHQNPTSATHVSTPQEEEDQGAAHVSNPQEEEDQGAAERGSVTRMNSLDGDGSRHRVREAERKQTKRVQANPQPPTLDAPPVNEPNAKKSSSTPKPSWRYVTDEDPIEIKTSPPPTARDARREKKNDSRSSTILSNMFLLFMTIGLSASTLETPTSHKKVMQSPQVEEWLEAEQKEINSLWDVGAWAWEKLPFGRTAIRSKWTFALKTDAEGVVQRFKARICARGDMTEEGIDYNETFSPVAKWESIRLFLAMTVLLHLIPMQLDVDLAYLYAPLDEAIYMIPPEGMSAQPGMVLRLLRSLYGLPQSGRNWYAHIDSNLNEAGFRRMEEDTCLYVRVIMGIITIVAVYVDDMYIAATNSETITALIDFLKTKYKIKILGVPQQLLGVKITWGADFSTVSISIPKMIHSLAEKYNDLLSKRPTHIPINPGHNLSKQDCPSMEGLTKAEKDGVMFMQSCYRNLVGSFIWICHTCRPDIMYVTMILCMYMQNPGKKHWTVALQALDYLKSTASKGIRYSSDGNFVPYGYADSDFSAHETRRSVGSFLFMLAGGPFSWKSVLGKIIALSTCEAEIRAIHAAYHAIKEAIWLAKLFKELRLGEAEDNEFLPIKIHEDNLAAIMFTKNPVYHSTMKHLERALYWIRASVDAKLVVLSPTKTEDQWADIGTKAFFRPRFELLRDKFLVDCE